jgi:hypothetical protein
MSYEYSMYEVWLWDGAIASPEIVTPKGAFDWKQNMKRLPPIQSVDQFKKLHAKLQAFTDAHNIAHKASFREFSATEGVDIFQAGASFLYESPRVRWRLFG